MNPCGKKLIDLELCFPDAHAAAIEKAAKLRIVLGPAVSSPRLVLDDEAEQSMPDAELLVDPGKHHVLISAVGYKSEVRQVSVTQGEALRLDVQLTPVAARAVQSEPTHGSPWKALSVGLGLGVTATGVTLGIVSATQRHNAQGRVSLYGGIAALCSAESSCTPAQRQQTVADLTKASNDKDSATRWEIVGFTSAGVGAAATIALWSLWPSSRDTSLTINARGGQSAASYLAVTSGFWQPRNGWVSANFPVAMLLWVDEHAMGLRRCPCRA